MNTQVKEIDLQPHRLSVADLLLLDEGGAFDGLGKVELLDGKLYEVSSQRPKHALFKTDLGMRLYQQLKKLGSNLTLVIEATVKIPPYSAPEPDILITSIRQSEDYYPAEAVKLAIEISGTTLKTDLRYKKALYADAGIPEYWVVDLEAEQVHLFWSPEGEEYRDNVVVEIGTEVSSRTIGGLTVDTAAIL